MPTRLRGGFNMSVGIDRAHEEPDLQQATGLSRGIAHAFGVGQAQRHRCFAEDMLAMLEGRDRKGWVQGAWKADVDGIEVRRPDQGVRPIDRRGTAGRRHSTGASGGAAKHADNFDIGHARIGSCMDGGHRSSPQDADPDHRVSLAYFGHSPIVPRSPVDRSRCGIGNRKISAPSCARSGKVQAEPLCGGEVAGRRPEIFRSGRCISIVELQRPAKRSWARPYRAPAASWLPTRGHHSAGDFATSCSMGSF